LANVKKVSCVPVGKTDGDFMSESDHAAGILQLSYLLHAKKQYFVTWELYSRIFLVLNSRIIEFWIFTLKWCP